MIDIKKTVLARVKELRAGTQATASLEQTKRNIQKRIQAAQRETMASLRCSTHGKTLCLFGRGYRA